jgi:hypothetical protein
LAPRINTDATDESVSTLHQIGHDPTPSVVQGFNLLVNAERPSTSDGARDN